MRHSESIDFFSFDFRRTNTTNGWEPEFEREQKKQQHTFVFNILPSIVPGLLWLLQTAKWQFTGKSNLNNCMRTNSLPPSFCRKEFLWAYRPGIDKFSLLFWAIHGRQTRMKCEIDKNGRNSKKFGREISFVSLMRSAHAAIYFGMAFCNIYILHHSAFLCGESSIFEAIAAAAAALYSRSSSSSFRSFSRRAINGVVRYGVFLCNAVSPATYRSWLYYTCAYLL